MRKITILVTIFLLAITANLFAQDSIKAQVSKTSLSVNDFFVYTINAVVFGSGESYLQLPKFTGFVIISAKESTKMTFEKNQIKRIFYREVVLSPKNPGKLKIDPTCIKTENPTLSSESFEIEVTPKTNP